MQDINFIPNKSGSKRSKRSQQTSGIQYTSGEVFDVSKPKSIKVKPAPLPKQKLKKKPSFFEWRTEKGKSAQEEAEAEERMHARARVEEPHTVPQPKKKRPLAPNVLHAENASEVLKKKQLIHVAPEKLHTGPASDLLHGKVYSMPVTQPAPEPTGKRKKTRTPQLPPAEQLQIPHPPKAREHGIHVPPLVEPEHTKKKWFTLRRQEADTTTFEVNLIPSDILAELQTRNYIRELLYVAIAACMLVLIVFAALNVYQRKIATDTAVLETQIQEFDSEIAGYIGLQTEVAAVSDRLDSLSAVLQSHVYWEPFLQTVESLTLSTVFYQSMNGTATTGSFVFEAYARSYRDIDAQVRVLRQSPVVRSVSVDSAATLLSSAEESGEGDSGADADGLAAFNMTVEFDPSLFQHRTQTQL